MECVAFQFHKLQNDGHEIAQAGTYHTYGPDMARGAQQGEELLTLDFDEQIERIRAGVIDLPLIDISSTRIRRRLEQGSRLRI